MFNIFVFVIKLEIFIGWIFGLLEMLNIWRVLYENEYG